MLLLPNLTTLKDQAKLLAFQKWSTYEDKKQVH